MSVTAIVPVYGPSPSLERCLASLETQVDGTIVVDDGTPSPGRCWRSSRKQLPLRRPVNGGFAAACNDGAWAISDLLLRKAGWLLFCNSDVELLPGCVDAMLAIAGPRTIVGAKLLSPDGTIQHGGWQFLPSLPHGEHRYRFQPRDYAPAGRTEPCLVTGALLLIARAFWRELGGFDGQFRMAWEDLDLELRALEAGGQVVYCGAAEAYHPEGATRGLTPEERQADADHRRWAEWESEGTRLFAERWPPERLAAALERIHVLQPA